MSRDRLIYSIGHGTRPIEEFVGVLREAEVRHVVDVRTAPRSRRHPHFDARELPSLLAGRGIAYTHLKGLGGWRRAAPDSPHVALRVPGFRGYADQFSSEAFARDYERLTAIAREARTAFMCAETQWWRCHRRILSDRLLTDGWSVVHLVRAGERSDHGLSPMARVVDGRLLYDVFASRERPQA